MVCDRCILSVQKVFETNGVFPLNVQLGEVTIKERLTPIDLAKIGKALKEEGFEIIDRTSPIIITQIKAALVSEFNKNEISEDFKLSSFLTNILPYDYSHLSRVFSHHEKVTIEQYLIRLRIEKAKELLTYKDQRVSEVAYKLGYASVAHFSRQFKKITGVSPSVYQDKPTKRQSLEDI